MNRLLDRYLFRELFSPFLLGVLMLTLLMLLYQLLRLTEWVMDKGISLGTVVELFLKLLPSFFLLTLPMAVAFAAIIAFNRLSFDNELTAIYASGVGFFRLLQPVFAFAVLTAGATLLMGVLAHQWGASSIKSVAIRMLKEKIGVGLDAGRFTEILPGLMIYTEEKPTPTEMSHVFIYDGRSAASPRIIAAQKGVLINRQEKEEGSVGIELTHGVMHADNRNGDHLMTFGAYSLKMHPPRDDNGTPFSTSKGGSPAHPAAAIAFHKKYALAAASFLFAFMGVPLGLLSGKAGRLGAVALGIGLILLYYALNTVGDTLALSGGIAPWMAAWIPNLMLTPIAVILLGLQSELRRLFTSGRPT
jgi:lipopolysaccharide export system permease protein